MTTTTTTGIGGSGLVAVTGNVYHEPNGVSKLASLWNPQITSAIAKLQQWRQRCESERAEEQKASAVYSFCLAETPALQLIDAQLLDAYFANKNSFSLHIDNINSMLLSVLQNILLRPQDHDVVATAKLVSRRIKRYFYECTSQENRSLYIRAMPRVYGYSDRIEGPREQVNRFWYLSQRLRRQLKVLTKSEKCTTDQSIRALLQLTWLHGSKAVAIQTACEQTGARLLPTGTLREKNVMPLSGELQEGANAGGINYKKLSGTSLRDADMAMRYATLFSFNLERELDLYKKLLISQSATHMKSRSFCDYHGEFTRAVEAFRRIRRLRPLVIENDILQWKDLIEKLYVEINETFPYSDTSRGDKSFLLGFVSSLELLRYEYESVLEKGRVSNGVLAENYELASIPVVFGSKTICGVPVKYVWADGPDPEEVVDSMRLGTDIQYVFTSKEYTSTVQRLISKYKLTVQVLDMEYLTRTLDIEKANEVYFGDVFGICPKPFDLERLRKIFASWIPKLW